MTKPIRNVSYLKAALNPFESDSGLGDSFIYSDMFKDATLKNIQSVSILPDGKTAYALDKITETTELTTRNIHKINITPQAVGEMVETLVKHDVDVNIADTSNTIVMFFTKFGEAVVNICIFALAFSLITRLLAMSMNNDSINALGMVNAATFLASSSVF